jgi:AcrR family transcriptional regulator
MARRGNRAVATYDETSPDFWGDEYPPVARDLLTSAVSCFASKGFNATTTRDITAAVNLSPGALYVHFPSKEEVLFAIIRIGHQRVLEAITVPPAGTAEANPAGVVGELVRRFVTWHARYHTVARVGQFELAGLNREHYELVTAQRQMITSVFRSAVSAGIDTGDFDVSDINRAVRAIISIGVDIVRWYRLDGTEKPEEVADSYARLAQRMLGVNIPDRSAPAGRSADIVHPRNQSPRS